MHFNLPHLPTRSTLDFRNYRQNTVHFFDTPYRHVHDDNIIYIHNNILLVTVIHPIDMYMMIISYIGT